MNVIVVNDFAYVNGGASKVAIESAIGLSTEVEGTYFFSSVGPIDWRLTEENIKVVCLGQQEIASDHNRIRAIQQGLWNRPAKRAMGELLADLAPAETVIHLHTWTKALSSSIVREAVSRGFKIVCTLHDYFLACPNGGFYDYKKHSICSLTPLSRHCVTSNCDVRNYGQKLYRVLRQLVQNRRGFLPEKIDEFIYISEFSHAILRQYLPQETHLSFVENPIDCCRMPPVRVEENDHFVAVGRVSPEKGVKTFLRVAQSLHAKSIVVGGGIDLEDCKREFVGVEFTGWLTATDANTTLQRARALVFPSLWYETQGLVVLEACALGIPAIVSGRTAARDFVSDGESGLLYEDEDELKQKMQLLLSHPAYAADLGRRAYERFWSDPPLIKKHISELLGVYRRMLGMNASGGN